jgi:predicted metalloprotease with PDZ domain
MRLHFQVRLDRPHLHLLGVEMRIEGVPPGPLRVRMPEWLPGHYSIMNNARFVQDLEAHAGRRRLPAWKTDKQTWEIETGGARTVVIRYDFFAHTLTSGASCFDDTQCHINGGNAFLYPVGGQGAPCTLSFADVPRGWRVATGLVRRGRNRWWAPDYDDFIDCPVKVGTWREATFRVRGKAHHIVLSDLGDTAERLPRYARDCRKFVSWFADRMGGLPYADYWFLCDYHPTRSQGGALEHKNSTHLALPARLDSEDEEDYHRIVAVSCHEYFHLWNVKRIRPRPLGPFDYTKEQHTTDLWIAEGLTDYYTWYALARSGILSAKQYLTYLARTCDSLADMPGRETMTLREASWDTWTQSFWNARQSAEETNALNRYVNYYTKGGIVGALLDIEILAATRGRRGLDAVFRALMKTAGEAEGFEPGAFEDAVERIAGNGVRDRLERWVGTTEPLPYVRTFAKAGLRFSLEEPSRDEEAKKHRRKVVGTLGLEVDDDREFLRVRNAIPGGPAARAGLWKGDLLLAADGRRLAKDDWRRLLGEARPGRPIRIAHFRHERLRTATVVPQENPRTVARFAVVEGASPEAERVRRAWLGRVPVFKTASDPTQP